LSKRPGDFSEQTKKLLADRAGHECSLPYCRVRTVGPGATETQTAKVGQASHIYSAGLSGPRGRGGLTDAQLADPNNGIWTCELHGKEIDNNKGDAFPAGLLRSWKTLHEARIKRISTGAPAERWIETVLLIRTPLFEANSILQLGKVTVIGGTIGAGKTAICEWVAAVCDKSLLNRWVGSRARQAIDLKIAFTSDKDHDIGMSIPVNGTESFTLDGHPQLAPPPAIDTVFLSRRNLPSDAEDDLRGLAKFFSVDTDTIQRIAEVVGASGNKRFRHMGFELVPIEEDELPESVVHADGQPKMQLVIETYSPAEKFPLSSFGSGVHTEVLLAMAIELAKFKSQSKATLLLIDAGDWGFAKEAFEQIADPIDGCAKHCQIIMIEPHNRLDSTRMSEREWVHYEIEVPRWDRDQSRPPAALKLA
jgi:hypothetical protein